MSEYIDREKVYIMLNAVIEGDEDEEVLEALESAKRFIADIPAVPVKAADKEDVKAAAKTVRSWCASKDEYCTGCPFAVKIEGMKRSDCILCDCFPARWNLGEVIADE